MPTIEKVSKGTPKKDGTGRGQRANKGRGGCAPSQQPKSGRGK